VARFVAPRFFKRWIPPLVVSSRPIRFSLFRRPASICQQDTCITARAIQLPKAKIPSNLKGMIPFPFPLLEFPSISPYLVICAVPPIFCSETPLFPTVLFSRFSFRQRFFTHAFLSPVSTLLATFGKAVFPLDSVPFSLQR